MYNRRWVFWASCLGILVFGIGMITLGSVAPALQTKFSLSEVQIGLIFSVLPFGILAGSLLFGPWCDRYGYKGILVIALIIMTLGFWGIAWLTSYSFLLTLVFFFGLAGGIINGGTSALVADISTDNKGADLALMGVFFGLGALGLPFLLGSLQSKVSVETILVTAGIIALGAAIGFGVIKLPPPKNINGFPLAQGKKMLSDVFLLLTGFFLFFQSAFEGIINNWTTLYLRDAHQVGDKLGLFALSAYMAGMTVMRLLMGTLFRKTKPVNIVTISMIMLVLACLCIQIGGSGFILMLGMVLFGGGLGCGFPVMLGLIGAVYTQLSGTAFSIAFVLALTGNMILNYLMGLIADQFGIQNYAWMVLFTSLAMSLLAFIIFHKYSQTKKI